MIYTVTLNPSIDYIVRVTDIELGQLNRADSQDKYPGGKGINVSRILQRLGTPTTSLGFIGGFTGDFIQKTLQNEGIICDFTTIKSDTRINIKLKATSETEINGQGPHLNTQDIHDLKEKLSRIQAGDIVVLAGSLPTQLPIDFYNQLIEIIKEKQADFVIDTTGDSLLKALVHQPLLIKPNHHELAEIFQTQFTSVTDILPYGQKLLDMGAQNVLVSMGKDGALLFTSDGNYRSTPIEGTLKNSVGAGDSMVAGFISQLAFDRQNIKEAFTYGVACGSATAFSDDLATTTAIKQLLKTVKLTKIA